MKTKILKLFLLSILLTIGLSFSLNQTRAATLNVCPGCILPNYSTIQAAITASSSGDTISVGTGTYTVTTSMAVSKTLTIQGDGSYPKIFYNAGGGASNIIFNVTANNVVVKNLEFYSPIDINGTRSNYAVGYTSGSNLMIDDCKFHDLKRALNVTAGTTLTVQNSEISMMNRDMINIGGGTGAFTITHNWIHDASFLGGSTSAVLIVRDNLVGGIGEVSYNYIEGTRVAILYNPTTTNAPTSGSFLFAHNTIDNTWTSITSYKSGNVLTPSYNAQGIGIYDPSAWGIRSSAITIRDNIIANAMWYGTHYNGGTLGVINSNLQILNSIYWNNYWDALNSGEGTIHYPNEWFGTGINPQIAWQGTGAGIISPNINTKTLDPMFASGAKITASTYYALLQCSPAYHTASDGQNIGAWQGDPGACSHTLTYTAGTGGTITGTNPQSVNDGSDGTAVTAVPNTGYHFVNWSDASTSNPRTDTGATANISVIANFATNTYTLTYTAGTNGTLTGTSSQIVNYNDSGSSILAVANSGYHFANWSDASTSNPRTDTNVTGNISVTANFEIDATSGGSTGGSSGGGGGYSYTPSGNTVPENSNQVIVENEILNHFTDMNTDSDDLECVVTLWPIHAISGYPDGTLKMEKIITRAEFVALIIKVFGLNIETQFVKPYKDIIPNQWYSDYIVTGKKYGIITGYGDNNFRSNQEINRAELMTILIRAMKYSGTSMNDFTDVQKDQWYSSFIGIARRIGLVTPFSDGTFRPMNSVTRGDAMTFVCRALEILEMEPTDSYK